MQNRGYNHRRAINQAKIRAGCRCELCGSQKDIQGHHMEDYSFGGIADPDKILVVCKSCHDRIHNGEIHIKSYDYR